MFVILSKLKLFGCSQYSILINMWCFHRKIQYKISVFVQTKQDSREFWLSILYCQDWLWYFFNKVIWIAEEIVSVLQVPSYIISQLTYPIVGPLLRLILRRALAFCLLMICCLFVRALEGTLLGFLVVGRLALGRLVFGRFVVTGRGSLFFCCSLPLILLQYINSPTIENQAKIAAWPVKGATPMRAKWIKLDLSMGRLERRHSGHPIYSKTTMQ